MTTIVDDTTNEALEGLIDAVRRRVEIQDEDALVAAMSDAEIQAEREQAERLRAQRREQRRKIAEVELAEETAQVLAQIDAAKKRRKIDAKIADIDLKDDLHARLALAEERRSTSITAQLSRLHRNRTWSARGAYSVIVASVIMSAVAVQHNLAPDAAITEPRFWTAYFVEALVSICLIILMVGTPLTAQWGIEEGSGKAMAAEVFLLVLTVTLNVFPYARAGDLFGTGTHALPPIMMGIAILIHHAASERYGLAISRATEQLHLESAAAAAPTEHPGAEPSTPLTDHARFGPNEPSTPPIPAEHPASLTEHQPAATEHTALEPSTPARHTEQADPNSARPTEQEPSTPAQEQLHTDPAPGRGQHDQPTVPITLPTTPIAATEQTEPAEHGAQAPSHQVLDPAARVLADLPSLLRGMARAREMAAAGSAEQPAVPTEHQPTGYRAAVDNPAPTAPTDELAATAAEHPAADDDESAASTEHAPIATEHPAVAAEHHGPLPSTSARYAEQALIATEQTEPPTEHQPSTLQRIHEAAAAHRREVGEPNTPSNTADRYPPIIRIPVLPIATTAEPAAEHPAETPTAAEHGDNQPEPGQPTAVIGIEEAAEHQVLGNQPAEQADPSPAEHDVATEQLKVLAEHLAEHPEIEVATDSSGGPAAAEHTATVTTLPMPAAEHLAEQAPELPDGDPVLATLALEVHQECGARLPVEKVLDVLAAEANGVARSRIARETGINYDSVRKWLTVAKEIRDRSATVIPMPNR